MPPFCAPSPPYLLSERPLSIRSPPPEVDEHDDRAQMVASLVTALTEAAAAEESNADNPEQRHLLSTQAYTSLCFDFPIVSTNALAALASSFRSTSLGTGTPLFPVTERFISGLRYLVSIEFTKQSTLDGPVAVKDVNAEREGESVNDSKFRCTHLSELCGCVFLLAPALRLEVAHNDDGVSLQNFLALYDPTSVDLLEQDCTPDDATASSPGLDEDLSNRFNTFELESEVQDDMAAEMDDVYITDDSDWEALESFTSPSQVVMSEEPTIPRDTGKPALSNLMSKMALLTQSVPIEVIKTGVWEQLQLTDHLIQALNGMRMLERKQGEADASPVAKLYAELLSEHLLVGWSTSASEVTQVVTALMVLVNTGGETRQKSSSTATGKLSLKTWNELVLSTLARLCSKVEGYSTESYKQSASKGRSKHGSPPPSPTFVRTLWQSVFSNVQFLQEQLREAQGRAESFLQLEMVLWILCFMVKYAPGNADLRATLLEGGIFRIALQLFVKVGSESEMEALHHFLLLSMASSTALAEFAAQVPSFTAAISAMECSVEGSSTGAHAVIWPLILHSACEQSTRSKSSQYSNQFKSKDAEGVVVAAFDAVVDSVTDGMIKTNPYAFLRKVIWVHCLLLLLEEATCASSGSTFKLWQSRSRLDISIGQCQVALGSVLAHLTETTSVSSPRQKSYRKKSEDSKDNPQSSDGSIKDSNTACPADESKERNVGHPSAHEAEVVAVQEKLNELLPSMVLQLKLLSALTKGNCEAKID